MTPSMEIDAASVPESGVVAIRAGRGTAPANSRVSAEIRVDEASTGTDGWWPCERDDATMRVVMERPIRWLAAAIVPAAAIALAVVALTGGHQAGPFITRF